MESYIHIWENLQYKYTGNCTCVYKLQTHMDDSYVHVAERGLTVLAE